MSDRLLLDGEDVGSSVSVADLLAAVAVIADLMERFVGQPDTPEVRERLAAAIREYLPDDLESKARH